MKTRIYVFIYCVVMLTAAISAAGAEGLWSWAFSLKRQKEVAPMKDAAYNEECGSCHFPYQGGLLPQASWKKLMAAKALEDHFGENAELDEQVRRNIESLLVGQAADTSYFKRSRKIMTSLRGEAPLRITEVPYIKRKHHDLNKQEISKNEQIKSLSYCEKCHRKADKGVYDDDTVVVPGKGKWTW